MDKERLFLRESQQYADAHSGIDAAYELWACYQVVCEKFDRTICTGPVKRGYIMPGRHEEVNRIVSHARMVVRHVNHICRNDGIIISLKVKEAIDRLAYSDVEKVTQGSRYMERLQALVQYELDNPPELSEAYLAKL